MCLNTCTKWAQNVNMRGIKIFNIYIIRFILNKYSHIPHSGGGWPRVNFIIKY